MASGLTSTKLEIYSKRMIMKFSSMSLGADVHLNGQLLAGITHLKVPVLKFHARVWLHSSETAWHISLIPGCMYLCPSTPWNISTSPASRAALFPNSCVLWSSEAWEPWSALNSFLSLPIAKQALCFPDLSFEDSLQALSLLSLLS